MLKNEEEKIRQYAINTIINIWITIDWDKVDTKRAYGIWDEMSSKVKSSAMTTNSYEKFIEKICRKLDIRSLNSIEINNIRQLDNNIKRLILKLFREETLGIMLEVRLSNQVRKEKQQAHKKVNNKESNKNEN